MIGLIIGVFFLIVGIVVPTKFMMKLMSEEEKSKPEIILYSIGLAIVYLAYATVIIKALTVS